MEFEHTEHASKTIRCFCGPFGLYVGEFRVLSDWMNTAKVIVLSPSLTMYKEILDYILFRYDAYSELSLWQS